MRTMIRIGVLAGFGACGPVPGPNGQLPVGETSSGAPPTSTEPATESSSGETSSSTRGTGDGSSSTTGCSFVCASDLPAEGAVCDGWGQSGQEGCPEGQKCTVDDTFNVPGHCIDVVDEPKAVGEPCTTTGGPLSGHDDCGVGLVCWDVDTEGHGTCVAFCLGPPEIPTCTDPTTTCVSCQVCFGVCIPGCDPLAADCEAGDVCIGESSGQGFICVLDASGEEGQAHDPCAFANACDPGLLCVNSSAAAECDENRIGCCEPFCALSQGDAQCPGAGQICSPYYEEGAAPAGQEDIGACTLPP